MSVAWLQAFLDGPACLVEPLGSFWSGVTGAQLSRPWPERPEFRALDPPTGTRYLHLQVLDGPARVHPDLICQDVAAEAQRLVSLGATAGTRERWWQVLRSPGGLPFCLVAEMPGRVRPQPLRWPDGHRSRVSQLAIDVPADRWDTECAFWQLATGWTSRTGRRPEFRWLTPPASSPLQVLLQRLDEPHGAVRAHLDIGSDDIEAEVRRVVELGARITATPAEHGGRWVALVDPGGLPFCVTPQPPD